MNALPREAGRGRGTPWTAVPGIPTIRLQPGDVAATSGPALITTVLGSCVAVCMRDPVRGVGGMNHYLLPVRARSDQHDLPSRYGVHAMEVLIDRLLDIGCVRSRLEAKIFGGGAVLGARQGGHVGELNVAFILGYLALEHIPLVGRDVLAEAGRVLWYLPHTGQAYVRRLGSSGAGSTPRLNRWAS